MSKPKILRFTLGELQTNTYLVADEESKKAVIIDPADAGEFLVDKIKESEYKVEKILATHGHFDHLLAATYLQLTLNVPFLIHSEDEFLVKRIQKTAKHFLGRDPGPPPQVSGNIKNKDEINVGSIKLKAISVPGHTPGSVAFAVGQNIFVGDLVFAKGGVGRTDFAYADNKVFLGSLKKILSFSGKTVIYPGHGEKTKVENELKYHKNLEW